MSCRKRKEPKQLQEREVYIKKPLNAFMLFMKHERPLMCPEIRRQGSGVVSAHLGMAVSLCLAGHPL